jgi:ubiquinone/menaquinone biosynthesis C-methylase UbiE
MKGSTSKSDYLLGSTEAEHERLIRQGAQLAPVTERFFRDAGIGPGQRVLDLGSGVGDVAMLAARLVGPSGEVVGIERDPRSIARAKTRASEAGLRNVVFAQSEIAQFSSDKPFDALVGRYILQFLPDPVSVLRSMSTLVRPGGVVAFQEQSWGPFVLLSAHLPLYSACVLLLREVSVRSGVNMEMGVALYKAFQDAGLPAPSMRLEMELGHEPDFTRWVPDVVCILAPKFQEHGLSLDPLGDLDTLQERIQMEVTSLNTIVPWLGLIGAWCRKPAH